MPILPHRLIVVILSGLSVLAQAAPDNASGETDVGALRGILDKWVDVQKALSKEKSEAGIAKQLLQQRIELVSREIDELRKKKTESEAGITEADIKKAELVAKKDVAITSLGELDQEIPALESEVKGLQTRLPDPVKEKLAPLFARIPEAGKPGKISLAERFQNIVGILNEINKANLEINLVSEIRPIDNKPTEVKTLYVGLGQAYYVNATGKLAGTGRPGSDGWIWLQDNSLAAPLRSAIGMLQSKSAAKFIPLPMQVD